jgi:uncharacterized protein
MINKSEIVQLTEEQGGAWGLNHTKRLLHLTKIIGVNQKYDDEIVWLSAHLHDWGGYGRWKKSGVDHAMRSKEVAEKYLQEREYPQEQVEKVLVCIENHHKAENSDSIEAQLLFDADALDFLGCVGVLRMFSMKPRDMKVAYETAKKRRDQLPDKLCLEKSKEIAIERLERMDQMLTWFEQETNKYF